MKKLLRRLRAALSLPSIRTRLLLFSVLTALTLGLTSLYSHFNARFFLDSLVSIFQRNQDILELQKKMENVDRDLSEYLSDKSSESLLRYWRASQELYDAAWIIDRRHSTEQAQLMRKNISYLTESYLKKTEVAVSAKRGRDIAGYIAAFEEAQKIAGYLRTAIEGLNLHDFQNSLELGFQVSKRLEVLQLLNNILVIDLVALSLALSFWFSWRLTAPLTTLAEAAVAISRGRYDTTILPEGRDEIGLLAKTFNSMKQAIVKSIDELKEKATIESGLLEERLKNLQMKNLLKNAELQALQAQINPHFLFNTLNAGAQLALMEEAEQTRLFMDNLADLLRHNIRQLDKPVFLSDEVRSLDNYVYLLKIRFADRFHFEKLIQDYYYDLKVPAMILQPLVENALLHGLKDLESGGRISLTIRSEARRTIVAIQDNGEGMSAEMIQRYLHSEDEVVSPQSGQSTGIGLGNVIQRLRLFFGQRDIIQIQAGNHQGTKITLLLPHPDEEATPYV